MGLTIHYTLTATQKLDEKEVRQRVRQTARLARRIGCPYVGKVLPAAASDPDAPEFFDSVAGRERRMFGGPRTRGWLVELLPGTGCESVTLGLCRRYRLVTRPPKRERGGWLPCYQPDGWRLDAWCKTYYAAEHGLKHFVQCHERVVRLLELWRGAGVRLQVHDECGFWKTRSREALAAQIGDHKLFLKVAQSRVWV
jgi:hypothetical protein